MLSDPYKATTGALTGIGQLDHEDGGCRPASVAETEVTGAVA